MDKLESEGEHYAFTDYGLSYEDLDDDVDPAFRTAAKDAQLAHQRADDFTARLYAL